MIMRIDRCKKFQTIHVLELSSGVQHLGGFLNPPIDMSTLILQLLCLELLFACSVLAWSKTCMFRLAEDMLMQPSTEPSQCTWLHATELYWWRCCATGHITFLFRLTQYITYNQATILHTDQQFLAANKL